MKILKNIGEVIALILGILAFLVIMCISTNEVCSSDAVSLCSFMCTGDKSDG